DGTFVCAVEWDAWQVDSWLSDGLQSAPRLLAALADRRAREGIALADGFDLLVRVLAAGLPRVAVSRREPSQVVEWHDRLRGPHGPAQPPGTPASGSSPRRGDLRPYLRRLVADTLGGSPPGDEVNLADFGLNSLLAID